MEIDAEKAKAIKEQLLKQLGNFPEDKRSDIRSQIESMTLEELGRFVEQNNLTHMGSSCIFCSIAKGEVPSYKIDENNSNIAVLELNPLSKGHALIIPKEHDKGVSLTSHNLAKKVKQKLWTLYDPQEIQINEVEIMGHKLLDVTPIYGNEKDRHKASEDELAKLQEEIIKPIDEVEEKIEKEHKEEVREIFKMKPRIP